MSIPTLLEIHFLEAKVSVDSHTQDTIRTVTTFHQLWLCNTSVCVCWLTDKWEHITWCGRSTTLSNPQNVTSSLNLWDDYLLSGYMMYHCTCPNIQVQFVWPFEVEEQLGPILLFTFVVQSLFWSWSCSYIHAATPVQTTCDILWQLIWFILFLVILL